MKTKTTYRDLGRQIPNLHSSCISNSNAPPRGFCTIECIESTLLNECMYFTYKIHKGHLFEPPLPMNYILSIIIL